DVITVDMLPFDEKILKTYGSDENADIYKVKLEIQGYQNQYSKNCLQRNNGNGSSFSETSLVSGVSATDWSWAPLFADFDNDGNKDLFISSGIVRRPVDLDYVRYVSALKLKGMDQNDKYDDTVINAMPDGSSHPFLYKGDGHLLFKDMSMEWGTGKMKGYYNGSAYADLDNDGNLDLVINCLNAPAVILKNNAPSKSYISVSFKGDSLNTSGIGAKAYLFSKEKIQYQQLMLCRGFQSSSDSRLHFGLDTLNALDSLLIVWPDQKFQVIKNVAVNKQLVIYQKNANGVFNYSSFFKPSPVLFTNISEGINVNWKHKENDFFDYNVQNLIPHAQSTRGPKIAVSDVNKDELEDFYVCGASGQPGELMTQTKEGKFIQSSIYIKHRINITEEVDAVFFDANSDSYPDLYVVSGGNVYEDGNPSLADHLYLNDGKGQFFEAENSIPTIFKNKSCVGAADFDKDGDIDLFVGGLADAQQYGIPQPSYLLINNGKGNFKVADETVINLNNLGITTSSSFADINKDGWDDLIVTGEWMPIKIFINNKGKYAEIDIPKSTGLWQTLYATDVNGDGFTDILAGNWGHNTKLWAGKNGPCKLFVKDFDNNGSVEQIMAYTIDDNEYTFLAKDELERRLPVLKKAYLKYSEVAGKTVQFMFYDLFKDYVELEAEDLSSSCFINDGKGNFKKSALPDDLQLAPIFSFQKINTTSTGENMFLVGGNFFDVIPYEGRYDAQALGMFSIDKNRVVNSLPQMNLSNIKGQVRDLKWIRTFKYGDVLMAARNDETIVLLANKK
ncbi:MAG: VCBS repeat-containing protein, partial [Ginsengibacter sp.]